jgi:hypothetical protein
MESLYRFPSTSSVFTLKSTPMVAEVSSSVRKSSSVNRRRRDDLPGAMGRASAASAREWSEVE